MPKAEQHVEEIPRLKGGGRRRRKSTEETQVAALEVECPGRRKNKSKQVNLHLTSVGRH